MEQCEVIIIGAGSAGLSARDEVAKVTDSYVVVDPGPLGTTCARVGCMPSKALIEAANAYHRRHLLSGFGVRGADQLKISPSSTLEHVRGLRDRFVASVTEGMQSWQENFRQGAARFVSPEVVRVGEKDIGFKRAIIAAGSAPLVPSAWQPYVQQIIDSDTIFDKCDMPAALAVVGLGSIGLELGQALSRLGADVTGFDPLATVGGLTSSRLQKVAVDIFREEFDIYFEAVEPVRAGSDSLMVRAGNRDFGVDAALLAVGRKPSLDALELENAGIEIGDNGFPEFNKSTLRIESSNFYIAGDVSGQRPVLHEAVDEGRIAGYNAVRGEDLAFRRRVPIQITFSDPNIAVIGAARGELDEGEVDYVVGDIDFSRQGRAKLKQRARGAAEIYLDRSDGKLLGAELIAPNGEHLAHMLATALTLEASVEDLLATPFYHPVLEEGLRTALKDAASRLEHATSNVTLMRCEEPPVGTTIDQ